MSASSYGFGISAFQLRLGQLRTASGDPYQEESGVDSPARSARGGLVGVHHQCHWMSASVRSRPAPAGAGRSDVLVVGQRSCSRAAGLPPCLAAEPAAVAIPFVPCPPAVRFLVAGVADHRRRVNGWQTASTLPSAISCACSAADAGVSRAVAGQTLLHAAACSACASRQSAGRVGGNRKWCHQVLAPLGAFHRRDGRQFFDLLA